MGSIIFWTDEKIKEQQKILEQSIKEGELVLSEEEQKRIEDKQSSSEPAVVINKLNQNKVLGGNT